MKAKIKSKLNLENRESLQDVIPLNTPFLIYVDPSSVCNFRCQFCPTGHYDLLSESNYKRSTLDFELFEKIISDIAEFDSPIEVMRMNKIGEPTINKHLPRMIELAKSSGCVDKIDLATNGALLTHELIESLIVSGLDRLNISLEGISAEQYLEHAKVKLNFHKLVETIKWLYEHKGNCELTIKIPGNYLDEDQKEIFFELFGNHCDRIYVEKLSPIWPSFDVEKRSGVKLDKNKGQYSDNAKQKDICTYIFYAMAINSDGTVSACCPDWNQELIVGDLKSNSLKEIWNSQKMNNLRGQHLEGDRIKNKVCSDCGHIIYAQIDNIDPYREKILKNFKRYVKELSSC